MSYVAKYGPTLVGPFFRQYIIIAYAHSDSHAAVSGRVQHRSVVVQWDDVLVVLRLTVKSDGNQTWRFERFTVELNYLVIPL